MSLVAGIDADTEAAWCDGERRTVALMGTINLATADLVREIVKLEANGGWQGHGIRSLEHWVQWKGGISERRAQAGSGAQLRRLLGEDHRYVFTLIQKFRVGPLDMDPLHPVLSERDSVLVLSREAGAADELGEDALLVNPYDTVETAEALHQALSMPEAERRKRRERLAEAAVALPPRRWFQDQLRSLGLRA